VARTALVMAETTHGRAKEIASRVKYMNGVKAVHVNDESYGIITLVKADNSDGIQDIASRLASIHGVIRCVVCSEREITDALETYGFAGTANDDYCWCAREPVF